VHFLLEADPTLAGARDARDFTPLHWAAIRGHRHCFDELLAAGGIVPDEAVCRRCHRDEGFDYAERVVRITHPRPGGGSGDPVHKAFTGGRGTT
jgi:ankyrin repeat protein